jgi:hypothetical protein
MSREVVIRTWCDNTAAHNGARAGVDEAPLVVSLGTHPPVEVDLCLACREVLVAPLAALLDDAGRPADLAAVAPRRGRGRARKNPSVWTCPLCNAAMALGSGAKHLAERHAKPLGLAVPTQPTVCPDCGFEHERAASMSIHRAASHAWNPRDELLALIAAPPKRRRTPRAAS